MQTFDLTGKKALITGSTQGIGYAIARCFVQHGAEVWINGASSEEKCRNAAAGLGCHYAFGDLRQAACAQRLYAQTGDVDILVLNASVQFRKAWNEITPEEFDIQMHTNFRSSLLLIQKYAPHMQAQNWGRILCVGSVQQTKPHKDMLIYAASKCAQLSMARNLAKQLAPSGITINNLAPGVFATPRNEAALSDAAYAAQVLAQIPIGYAAEGQDACGAALLLCSDAGRYITGADLVVDGGMQL